MAGNLVMPQTTHFTTTAPILVGPSVINENPYSGATNISLHAAITIQANVPVTSSTVRVTVLISAGSA